MADAGAGWHDREVVERLLRPAQQRVAFAVARVLELDVAEQRQIGAGDIDVDRVVDHQIGLHERVDPRGVAAEPGHRRAHRRQIHHRRDAGEVLQQDARRHEGEDAQLVAVRRVPVRERQHVRFVHVLPIAEAQHVLQHHLDRVRQARQVDPALLRQRPQAEITHPAGRAIVGPPHPHQITRHGASSTLA